MIAYIGLFFSAFVAATVFPMQSEAVLVALLVGDRHPIFALLTVATVGNVLGSVVNWYLGRLLLRFRERRWFPASDTQLERAEAWYRSYPKSGPSGLPKTSKIVRLNLLSRC